MIISFLNRQSRCDPAFYRDLAQRLFDAAEHGLPPLRQLTGLAADSDVLERVSPISGKRLPCRQLNMAVTITLAGPIIMRRVNREQRQVDAITDILSFPMLDFKEGRLKTPVRDFDLEICPDGSRSLFLGDLFLSPDKAVSQAADYGHTLERESAFLLVHGLLHLLGYDHKNKRQEAVMQQLAEDFLNTQNLMR